MPEPRAADLEQLTDWLADGTVRPVVTSTRPLAQVQDAHRAVERGHGRGKTVLVVDPVLAAQVPARPAAQSA